MSLRPIEMQGSFPQSQKTGKIQEQMQQRFQTRQELQAQEEEQKMKHTCSYLIIKIDEYESRNECTKC